MRNFERDLFPYFCSYDTNHNITSSRHISDITHSEIFAATKAKEKESIDTARRNLIDCNEIWLYAINKEYTASNIIANISKKSLAKYEVTHRPKITDEKILKELLEAIDGYTGKLTRYALKFVALNPYRVMNLHSLKWEYVDFEKALITIPRQHMKTKNKNFDDFTMPLSTQAVELLREIHTFTGWGVYLFHGSDLTKPMHKETCNRALQRLGFDDVETGRKQTTHSFRGTFRSLAETYEHIHNVSEASREACLDHHETDVKKRAYKHKANYTEQMRVLLQWWADYLDEVKNG